MTAVLSPAAVADLRACAQKWGVEGVLEEARLRREHLGNPWGGRGEWSSLDAPVVFTADAEHTQDRTPQELIDPDPDGLQELILEERVRLVNRAVRQLPLPEKRVIRLIYWDEYSLVGVGRALGFSGSRAQQIHHSALDRLRRWLLSGWYVREFLREYQ